jgi:large subunit ribosomal protein L35
MPKMKTHKGLRNRVRVTRNGKIVRRKAGKSHLMSGKSGKRCRGLRRAATVEGRFAKAAARKLAGG